MLMYLHRFGHHLLGTIEDDTFTHSVELVVDKGVVDYLII